MPQVVVAGDAEAPRHRVRCSRAAAVSYRPSALVVPAFTAAPRRRLSRVLPWVKEMGVRDGRATAYVCRDFACQAPVHTAEALAAQLGRPGLCRMTAVRRHLAAGRHITPPPCRCRPLEREPRAWTEADVAGVLTSMLRAMDQASNPGADPDRPIALRGFSWIVTPFEAGRRGDCPRAVARGRRGRALRHRGARPDAPDSAGGGRCARHACRRRPARPGFRSDAQGLEPGAESE